MNNTNHFLNSKLIHLFSSLTSKERLAFRKWIHSPIHNKHEEVIALFQYLDELKKIDATTTNIVVVVALLLSKKTEAKQATDLRHTMSYLTAALEEFLAYQYFTQNDTLHTIGLAKILYQKNLRKYADETVKKLDKRLPNHLINQEKLFTEYQIESFKFELEGTQKRDQDTNLQLFSHKLDTFYIAEKLAILNEIQSHANVHKTEYTSDLKEEVLALACQPAYYAYPLIALLYDCHQAIALQCEEHFQKLIQNLYQYENLLKPRDKKNIYLTAINFCIKKMNTGNRIYITTAFDLYKDAFEKHILLENNILSRFAYNNFISIALIIDKFEIAKEFLEKYNSYLEPMYQESHYKYNMANFYFKTKDYKSAKKILVEYEFEDVLLEMTMKMYLTKIYYETNDYELLENSILSFRQYLKRKKISGFHSENYTNVLKFLEKIYTLKNATQPTTPTLSSDLQEEIKNTTPLTEKSWLLAQLAALVK